MSQTGVSRRTGGTTEDMVCKTKNRQREALEADVVFYIIVVMPFYELFDIIYLQSEAISVPENDSHQGAKDVLSFN